MSSTTLPWHNIDTVFLDMDGTLLDLHFDNHFWLEHVPQRYSEKHAISVEAAKNQLFPKMLALRGQLHWYCTDFWSTELGLPIIELKEEVAHKIRPRPYVPEFLTALKTAEKRVILFTNAHHDTVAIKMRHSRLNPHFDHIVTSHQLGHPKEAQQSWQALAQLHSFDPARSLFIDDNFEVLESAQQYGIVHLLGIELPDLKGQMLEHDGYTLIKCFRDIMPDTPLPA